MARLTIHLQPDPQTNEPVVWVDLVSDEDALPHEHERAHRSLVARLFPDLELDDYRPGSVLVERERPAAETVPGCSGYAQPGPSDGGDDIDVIDL